MSEPSSSNHPSKREAAVWDDAEWLGDEPQVAPVPEAVPMVTLARAVVPEPRRQADPVVTAKPEGLRIEPRVAVRFPEDEEAPVGRKIQITEHGKGVIRLESEAPPVAIARLDQMPVLQPRNAKPRVKDSRFSEWGKAGRQSQRWLWWSGGGVIALVLIVLAIHPLLVDKDQDRTAVTFQSYQVVDDLVSVEDPTVYFSENPGEVSKEIHEALGTYARARSLEAALPVIRHGAALKEQLAKQWKSWQVPDDWAVSDSDPIGYDSVGKLPYALVSGTLPDFSTYRVFLVRENGRMLVDWEASLGLGTKTFEEMKNPATQGAELRVVMAPVGYYTQAFPESRYRAYRLASGTGEDFLWGYIENGSPAAAAMEEIFNEKALFSDKPREQMMRLRLRRGPAEALPNQWLVLDVLHKGWVTP